MGDRYRYDMDGDGYMTVLDDREAMTVEEIVSALNRVGAAIARVRELEEIKEAAETYRFVYRDDMRAAAICESGPDTEERVEGARDDLFRLLEGREEG